MAFETVDLHCSILVATLAEIPARAQHAVVNATCMTVHAADQAVSADFTLVHRDGSLLLEQIAVIEAHELGIVHAMPPFADIEVRNGYFRTCRAAEQHQEGQ